MWNEVCGKIFAQTIKEYEESNIRYFILRNYEGLPKRNMSKDVDIVIEPGKFKAARQILLKVYKQNGCSNYYEAAFHRLHCIHGIHVGNKIGIHIDLIEGYLVKGYEIFTFEEMYSNTCWYHQICVLNKLFEGMMILIYKLFGYKTPELKESYQDKIYSAYNSNQQEFYKQLRKITSEEFAIEITEKISNHDFENILQHSKQLTKLLKKYAIKKNPLKTFAGVNSFVWGKICRIVLCYRKHARVIAVIAPDGTGKTTFIENVVKLINYYYVNDEKDKRCDIRHFRPGIFPNLGELGEKTGFMEQDREWNKPHRGKPGNLFSSMLRMSYYMLDYIWGWRKIVRKNVQFDRFTIFDRYSYDFIVDPYRSKIKLPVGFRRFFVSLTPKPNIVFVLTTAPEIIYGRKQELSMEEIDRQCREYKKLIKTDKRFCEIDASVNQEEMAKKAIKEIVDVFTKKL